WGKGYATEAVRAVLKFGFRVLKLHRMEAGCAVDNIASIRVLEKVGMQMEGQRRKVLPLQQGWSDNYEFAILDTDFDQI
ncbi:MAG TPA: GNAT family protein, partial [Eudoraea sp.]|nr:GNAT family protein [Eudoraea sp.]